jgi:putative ABC transport system permease protein
MLRATLKSLLSRKLRLTLSGLAVVLGVMFVSGAFVLTDTLSRSFDDMFAGAFAKVDVEVNTPPTVGDEQATTVPAALLDKVRAVPGARAVAGSVVVDGARVIGANGKVVTTLGAPRFGQNWTGDGTEVMRTGRPPGAAGEVAMNAKTAQEAGLHVGDRVGILTRAPKQTFTLVGIYGYSGGRDSLGGSLSVAFTTPVAQQLMLGQPDVFTGIDVRAADGVSDAELKQRVAAAVGPQYRVQTSKELADSAGADVTKGLSFFNKILLGFAGVALFVGTFLILNTFSIIVAQRTRELALMRALGGARRQIIGSVLLEAVLIGVFASVAGLAAGVGVGAGLAALLAHASSGLQVAGIGLPASAVIASFAVGIGITVIAALLPALRAARIPPVAALAEVATPDRPLTRVSIAGAATTLVGAAVLGWGLSGAGGATLTLVLLGVLVSFIGVALLTPLVVRPVVSLVGAVFAWSVPGRLGRINSGRNPRRTAITAAALMIGLALITGVNVILASATASLNHIATDQTRVDLFISGDQSGNTPPTFDPAAMGAARRVSGVREAASETVDGALINGERNFVSAVDDLPALADMFLLKPTAGSLGALGPGQLVVDEEVAKAKGLHVGSTVTAQFAGGAPHTLTVVGVYARSQVLSSWIVSPDEARWMTSPQPAYGYLRLADGASTAAVLSQVDKLLTDSPEVTVADRTDFIKQQTSQFDSMLTMIQVLLGLAILIAVLGIVNTLALSVLERTRELGLLRAVGLRRGQVLRMVTVESVVISVFGALLGLAVGTGLGAAVVRALRDQGFTNFALPWTTGLVYLLLAALVGVVAAVLPAVRASRTNVLSAIAYE